MLQQKTLPALTLVAAFATAAFACGGSRSQATSPARTDADDAGTVADAGADAAAERPFAGSGAEAFQLVSAQIDKNRDAMSACVDSFRARKKLPTQRVELQVGIDQEGNLLGATLAKPKQQDPELSNCIQQALKGATFPKSHAGVISITKVYQELPP